MDKIIIRDLEVFYHVGVPDEERASPQRLEVTVEIGLDLSQAAKHDDLSRTIDYESLVKLLRSFGQNRSWKLIETVASDIAERVLTETAAQTVCVEVKKFVFPDAKFVSVVLCRQKGSN